MLSSYQRLFQPHQNTLLPQASPGEASLNASGREIAIAGAGVTGSPEVECCLADGNCQVIANVPGVTGGSFATCQPYVNVASTMCQKLLSGFCSGADLHPLDPTWISRWMNPDGTPVSHGCLYALQRSLFSGPSNYFCTTGPIVIPGADCGSIFDTSAASSEGLAWASALMESVAAKLRSQGFSIGVLPGEPGYTVFQNFLYQFICCPYPSVCQGVLSAVCRGFTARRLSLNPEAAKLCGCHLPASEYNDYVSRYQVNIPCTPTCSYPGTVPITDTRGAPYSCTQNVCLITDLSVNLVDSQVDQNLDISQLCSNCSSSAAGGVATCACIVEGDSLTLINSKVSGNVNISTSCTQATCVGASGTFPCNQVPVQGTCLGSSGIAPCNQGTSAPSTSSSRNRILFGVGMLIVALIAVAFLYLLIHPKLR